MAFITIFHWSLLDFELLLLIFLYFQAPMKSHLKTHLSTCCCHLRTSRTVALRVDLALVVHSASDLIIPC